MKFIQILKIHLRKISGRVFPITLRVNLNNGKMNDEMCTKLVECMPGIRNSGTERFSINAGSALTEEIITLCSSADKFGFHVSLTTDGTGLSDESLLKKIDLVNFILDTNEFAEQKNSPDSRFSKIVQGMQLCSRTKTAYCLLCDLDRNSIPVIPDLVQLAGIFKTMIGFQPIKHFHGADMSRKPDLEVYKTGVARLMEMKKTWQARSIRNSLTGLIRIYGWPELHGLRCHAGRYFLDINHDGSVVPCNYTNQPYKEGTSFLTLNDGNWLGRVLDSDLPDVNELCSGCGLMGQTEMNYYCNGKLLPILHLHKL